MTDPAGDSPTGNGGPPAFSRDPKPTPKDPGGHLLVTPTGSVVVSTDAMLASADALRVLEAELHADFRRVLAADAEWQGMPITDVGPALDRARSFCEEGRETLARAAEAYSTAERRIEQTQHELGAQVASNLGPVLFALFVGLAFQNPMVLAALALGRLVPGDGGLQVLHDYIRDNPEFITDPGFVRFVSSVATSVDDLGRPFGVPIGPSGGADIGALTLITLGSTVGFFRETPVTVERRSTVVGTAPTGVRDRLDRIPENDLVRIERYDAPGQPPRFAIFIGPTETFSPVAATEPRDLTSNVHGVANLSPGALRAVEQAMVDAGISPADEVQVAGFSQGGLIATMLAGSGEWNVVGVATYGAPAGGIALPEGLAGMAVRNTDDFIPALGGPQLDHHLLQVEREAFAGGGEIVTDQVVPAHQRTAYERTASAIDAAESNAIQQQIRALDAFASDYLDAPGGRATVMTYEATRVDGRVSAAASGVW